VKGDWQRQYEQSPGDPSGPSSKDRVQRGGMPRLGDEDGADWWRACERCEPVYIVIHCTFLCLEMFMSDPCGYNNKYMIRITFLVYTLLTNSKVPHVKENPAIRALQAPHIHLRQMVGFINGTPASSCSHWSDVDLLTVEGGEGIHLPQPSAKTRTRL